jgi:Protein of unknown function (DUF2809)
LRRSRLLYLLVGALVIVLGLASRRYGAALPTFVADYAGDTLWAVMTFIVIGVLAPEWPTSTVAIAALLASYADEVSQLYHAPWIDAIRNTPIRRVDARLRLPVERHRVLHGGRGALRRSGTPDLRS